ncbi:MAG: hypothetical protein AB7U75_08090 [Hyphomicrobiaceae bacterium]
MKRAMRAALVAVMAATAGYTMNTFTFATAAMAADNSGPYSARVRRACKVDYNRFCPGYSLYGTELRRCMQAAGKGISQRCIRALVDAGEVPRSMLKKGY